MSIYNILKGGNAFYAVWADTDASLDNGKFYVASYTHFCVVNAANKSLYDWYSSEHKGRFNETLLNEDVSDINVSD